MSDILKQKNIHVSSGAVSATFVKSNKDEPAENEAYLRYAHGIVSEYLMDDLSQKLLKYLNLPEEAQINLKRKSMGPPQQQDAKKPKTEEEGKTALPNNVLDLSKPEPKGFKQTPQTSKEKARAKAANDCKSLSSYFKKT